MAGVANLADLVTNVSLQETYNKVTDGTKPKENVSSNFRTPPPTRDKPFRTRKSQSVSSFVSTHSGPEESCTTLPNARKQTNN